MAINIRSKGQRGEREIADMLNSIIADICAELGFDEETCAKALTTVQRNQMQTAVGGNDLTNCFGMSIEVKRQENLSVGTWWKQCVASAKRNGELPVLIYRQNRKAWRIRTYVQLYYPGEGPLDYVEAEFDLDAFKRWFRTWVRMKLENGEGIRV